MQDNSKNYEGKIPPLDVQILQYFLPINFQLKYDITVFFLIY